MKTTFNAAAWFLAGALAATVSSSMAQAIAGPVQEDLHWTLPLAPDGRISLDDVNGSVHITTWDRAEVKLDALKKADSPEAMSELEIQIKTNDFHLRIHTIFPDNKRHGFFGRSDNSSVDYELTVPAGVRLKDITTVNGGIEIEGVRGDIKASTVNGTVQATGMAGRGEFSTVNGNVEATSVSLKDVKSISGTTVNGSVELSLPSGANADVTASTVNGGISGDVPVKKNWPVGASVNTKLGEGGTKVSATTVNGGIQIKVAK